MSVLSLEEFNQCSTSGSSSMEKICQGRTFIKGPVFSLANLHSAKLYCQAIKQKHSGLQYLIVKEISFFQVWSEIATSKPLKSDYLAKSEEISINSLPVETEFVNACQEKLTMYIGPIAKMVCKITLAKNKDLTRSQFVKKLAKKIPEPDLAQQFMKELLE